MAFRTRVTRGRGVVHRRPTFWGRSPADAAETNIGSGIGFLDSSKVAGFPNEVIIRIRGSLFIKSDQVIASESSGGALGFAVVTDQALAAGVGSIPTPFTDQDSDVWMLWMPWATSFTFVTGAGFDSVSYSRFDFDSKAMRKLPLGKSLVIVIENAASGSGLVYRLMYSVLFKTS